MSTKDNPVPSKLGKKILAILPWIAVATASPVLFLTPAVIILDIYVIKAAIDYKITAKKLAAEGWTIQDGELIEMSEEEQQMLKKGSNEVIRADQKTRQTRIAEYLTYERWKFIHTPRECLIAACKKHSLFHHKNKPESTIIQAEDCSTLAPAEFEAQTQHSSTSSEANAGEQLRSNNSNFGPVIE